MARGGALRRMQHARGVKRKLRPEDDPLRVRLCPLGPLALFTCIYDFGSTAYFRAGLRYVGSCAGHAGEVR